MDKFNFRQILKQYDKLNEAPEKFYDLSDQRAWSKLWNIAKKYDGKIYKDQGWKALHDLMKEWGKVTGNNAFTIDNYYEKHSDGSLKGKRWKGVVIMYPPQPKSSASKTQLDNITKSVNKKKPQGRLLYYTIYTSFDINPVGNTDKYEFNPSYLIDNGEKDVYEVELEDGSIVQATENHKFFNNSSEILVKDLVEGDYLDVTSDMHTEDKKRSRSAILRESNSKG